MAFTDTEVGTEMSPRKTVLADRAEVYRRAALPGPWPVVFGNGPGWARTGELTMVPL